MAFRFPNYPKFPKEFCGAARASLPLRVSRVTPSGAARTARVEGGSGPSRGERRGARPDSCRPACERFARDREAGFRRARRTLRLALGAANRSRSVARGRRAPEAFFSPPLRAASGPPKQGRAGNGSPHPLRRTHPPAPVCVSGSRTRPTLGGRTTGKDAVRGLYWMDVLGVVLDPCHELPGGAGDGVCG